jgi:hypothetical protein
MGDIRIAACLMKPHGCRRNLCCLFGELRLGVRFDLLDIVPSAVNGLDGKNFQLETMVFHFFLIHDRTFWCLNRGFLVSEAGDDLVFSPWWN